jgi:hypothetical protein
MHSQQLLDRQVGELARLGVSGLTPHDLEAVSHVGDGVSDLVGQLGDQTSGGYQPISLNELSLESLEPRLAVL